jgi:hypothetical protein
MFAGGEGESRCGTFSSRGVVQVDGSVPRLCHTVNLGGWWHVRQGYFLHLLDYTIAVVALSIGVTT